jgi:protein-S-isoprenylcysteine O-methyltransferase Ste14
MHTNIVILIISSTVWLIVEGILILRDKNNSKGSTKIDKRTRLFNTISTLIALSSPVFLVLLPSLNFSEKEIPAVTIVGTLMVCFGFILRHWSINVLGKYFRTTVEIENGQTIIQKGPYRFIRHPSYSGIILFCIGYGIISQNWLSLIICIVFPTSALLYRITVEEKAFVKELGLPYIEYQSRTKKLIPGIL